MTKACKRFCCFQRGTAATRKSRVLQAADRRLHSKGRVPSKWARVLVSTPRELQRRRSRGQSAVFHAWSESLSSGSRFPSLIEAQGSSNLLLTLSTAAFQQRVDGLCGAWVEACSLTDATLCLASGPAHKAFLLAKSELERARSAVHSLPLT